MASPAPDTLNVLTVTNYMPPHVGGIERVAESLVNNLRALGHDARWISSATPAEPGEDGHLVRVESSNPLEHRLGVPYPLWLGPAARAMLREVRRADVVHAHDCLYMGSAMAAAMCRALGKPFVITQHVGYVPYGPVLDRVQSLAYHSLGRAVLSSADLVISYSAHVEEHFASLGIRPTYRRIPNAVDTAKFRPCSAEERARYRERWRVPADAKVILFVGRLVAKKRFDQVVEVQRRLAGEGTVLVVAGDGMMASEMERAPNVLHRPNAEVPHSAMPEIYGLADLILLPSRGEGLPLSIQEALCCGLPAVVSDDPAYTYNLGEQPGVTMSSDVDDCTARVRAALAGPAPDRARIAAAAHKRWGGDQVISAHLALYREVIAARGTTRRSGGDPAAARSRAAS